MTSLGLGLGLGLGRPAVARPAVDAHVMTAGRADASERAPLPLALDYTPFEVSTCVVGK